MNITKLKSLKEHQGFVKYFKNTSWLMGEKFFRIAISLFVGIWMARYLGPEKFGLFSYAQSFVELFAIFITLGLDAILVKELLDKKSNNDILLGTAFVLKICGFFLMTLVLLVSIQFTNKTSLENTIIYIMLGSVFFQVFNVIDFFFQAKVLSKYIVFTNTIALLFSSIFKIILIINEASLLYFAMSVVLEALISALGYIYFYRYHGEDFKAWKFDYVIAKKLLYQSWPLILSGIAISLYMKIDQVMISNIMGNKFVAYYAVAVKFSNIWFFLTVILTNSLFPAILNAKNVSEEKYQYRIINLYRLLVIIAVVISILVYIFSSQLILYTYGIQYQESIVLLKLYIWSIIFVFLNNGSWKWYIAEGLQNIATIRLAIGAISNIILNYFWIKSYGLVGAAYATLISYAIATYFGNLFHKKTWINFKMQSNAIYTFYKIKDFNVWKN